MFSDPAVLASRQGVLDDGIDALFPNIPVEELTAIRHYSDDAYWELNAALRSGNLTPSQQAFADMFNNGLNKLPTYSGDLYRGTSLDIDLVINKYKNAFDNGVPVNEAHFSSASKDLNVAQGFIDDDITNLSSTLNPSTPNKKVKVMFYFEPGNAKEIENISFYGPNGPGGYNEMEAVFKSNSNFEVTNFKETLTDSDGNVIVEIFMKEI